MHLHSARMESVYDVPMRNLAKPRVCLDLGGMQPRVFRGVGSDPVVIYPDHHPSVGSAHDPARPSDQRNLVLRPEFRTARVVDQKFSEGLGIVELELGYGEPSWREHHAETAVLVKLFHVDVRRR